MIRRLLTNINMIHKPGKENEGADCLSQYQVNEVAATAPEIERNFAHTRWVNRVHTRSEKLTIPADMEEIIDASEHSVSYKKMIEHLRGERDHSGDPDIRDIEDQIEDITIDESYGAAVIYRKDCIIPPREIHWKLIELAHAAHQATESMYATVRQLWSWTGLKTELKNYYESCGKCEEYRKGRQKTPKVENTEVYAYAVSEYLSLDIGEYNSQYFLAARDRVSGFVMAEPINRQSSQQCIKVLEMWFSKVGIPHLCSENSPLTDIMRKTPAH